jgi:CubicO group peptidase (beta-lactamase class C family)
MTPVRWIVAACCTLGAAADRLPAPIEEYLRAEMALNDIPGLAVAVVHNSQVLAVAAYGVRDRASGDPMTAETPVELASVSKSFTALGLAELHRRGAVQLDDPLVRYLPEFVIGDGRWSSRIRVRHLLRHTSGLSRQDDFLVPCCGRPGDGDLNVAVQRLAQARLRRPPGEAFGYANSNYVLLAALIERVSGLPFPVYMRRYVFGPLGMNRTTLEEAEARAWGKAEGHERRWGAVRPGGSRFTGWYGASQVKSTAADMALYLTALLGPQRRLWQDTLHSIRAAADPRASVYDWGWFVTPRADWLGGGPVVEHGGDTWSANAAVVLAPQAGTGVAVLVNAGVHRAQPIARGVLLRVLGRPAPPPARQSWSKRTDDWAMLLAGASAAVLAGVALFWKRLAGQLRRGERRWGWGESWWERSRVVTLLLMAVYLLALLPSDAIPPLVALPRSLRLALPLLAVSSALLLASAAFTGLARRVG